MIIEHPFSIFQKALVSEWMEPSSYFIVQLITKFQAIEYQKSSLIAPFIRKLEPFEILKKGVL